MIKTAAFICLIAFLAVSVVTSPAFYSGWRFESATFMAQPLGSQYQISSDGVYIISGTPGVEFTNTTTATRDYLGFYDVAWLPHWLNGTMIYREYWRQEGWADPPECSDLSRVTFGFYDAITRTGELYCLTPDVSYHNQERRETVRFDWLERYPFDDHTVLIDSRFLVDLRSGIWQDWQGTLPSAARLVDTRQWMAHGTIWWDPQTRRPMAQLEHVWQEAGINEISSESILFCPIASDTCLPLVLVQDHIHGNVTDMIVSPDGQTLLWSSILFPENEPVYNGSPIGVIEDVAAFETDLQTGATTEIFRLSLIHHRDTKGTAARWSEDSLTLAIEMVATVEFASASSDNGMFIVHFSRTAPA